MKTRRGASFASVAIGIVGLGLVGYAGYNILSGGCALCSGGGEEGVSAVSAEQTASTCTLSEGAKEACAGLPGTCAEGSVETVAAEEAAAACAKAATCEEKASCPMKSACEGSAGCEGKVCPEQAGQEAQAETPAETGGNG